MFLRCFELQGAEMGIKCNVDIVIGYVPDKYLEASVLELSTLLMVSETVTMFVHAHEVLGVPSSLWILSERNRG